MSDFGNNFFPYPTICLFYSLAGLCFVLISFPVFIVLTVCINNGNTIDKIQQYVLVISHFINRIANMLANDANNVVVFASVAGHC